MSFVKSQTTPNGQPKASDNSLYVRPSAKTVGLTLKLDGGEFQANINSITKHQMKFASNIELVGALFQCKGAHTGDKINVKIVDVDNILGYGNEVVLSQFAIDVPAKLCETIPVSIQSSTSDILYAGLYLSMEYTNTHASETVEVFYSYISYR